MDVQDNKFTYYVCFADWMTRFTEARNTFLVKEDNFGLYLYSCHEWSKYIRSDVVEFIGRDNMKQVTEEEAFRYILEH